MGSFNLNFVLKAGLVIVLFIAINKKSAAQSSLPKIWGMVKIDNRTLMCETEVTIAEWMNFIANNDFDETLFPDTTCLSRNAKLVFNELRSRTNFEHLKLNRSAGGYEKLSGTNFVSAAGRTKKFAKSDTNYFSIRIPITGVSFQQVQRYCKWKETMLTNGGFRGTTLSLPTVEVYKKVIPNMDTISIKCDCFLLNCSTAVVSKPSKRAIINKLQNAQAHGLEPVISYFPTALGLYNIEGNAAEMTSTEGIAMGGSYRHTARESYNDKQENYTKPEDWLGFRYIVTLK